MRKTLARLVLPLLVCVAPSAAADDEPAFEDAPAVTAAGLLSAAERKGTNHTVADAVGTRRFMHTFRVESTYGRYDVTSRRLLEIRLGEIETMSKIVGMDGAPEFVRALGRRLAQIPTAAVEILIDPEDSFRRMGEEIERAYERFKDLFDKRRGSEYEDSRMREALTGVEKRKLAVELGLDVYSSNPKVQEFLNEIATARTAGTAGVDLASYALPLVGYIAVSSARLRADVTRLLRDKTPTELERHNDGVLEDVGVPRDVRQRFLRQAWLSPRHQTVIAAAVRELAGIEGVGAVPRAASTARDEVGALYQEQQAVLLAHHHTEVERLVALGMVGHVVVARTQAGRLIVIAPADQVYWMEPFADLVPRLLDHPISKDATGRQLVVTGRVTELAQANLERLGFEVVERYEPASK